MGDTAPLVRTLEQQAQPVATVGNDLNTVVGEAPWAATITAVSYTPLTAITGAATNNRTVSLVNKAQDGTGATVVATLNFGSGTNAAAADEKAITLSATPANLVVAAGDVLEWTSTHVGTGIADPGGLVRTTFSRN